MEENATVAVLGAGQMGSGIGQVFATAGYSVKIYDLAEQILEKSKNRIHTSLEKLKSKCLIDEEIVNIENRISHHTKMEELHDCSIFMESAFEDFSAKISIFHELSNILTESSLVATNTSSYSITSLAGFVPWPEKFIGLHFMNPPPIMELLEIIRGSQTSNETFDFFLQLAKKLKKTPIVSKNSPGFVLNRILIPMINEAIYALQENVSSTEQIDAALTLGANHPIGPLALADLIGLDTVLAILKTLQKELGENKYAPCPLLESYVTRGLLGKKTKSGFYEYQ
ncbi:MAG: 3-hydroxybutyryl-CoA dehydrogenase [Holosporaceae bacterium]|jgi:3-hydroxybutyryl-CoA dehydrogenase|nr:3-hydroxybutyryl-CoA dehydrogenase [Holosporaceae bacterium]